MTGQAEVPPVPLVGQEAGGVWYGVGLCTVTVAGRVDLGAVVAVAGEKWMLGDVTFVPGWLTFRGFPPEKARLWCGIMLAEWCRRHPDRVPRDYPFQAYLDF